MRVVCHIPESNIHRRYVLYAVCDTYIRLVTFAHWLRQVALLATIEMSQRLGGHCDGGGGGC